MKTKGITKASQMRSKAKESVICTIYSKTIRSKKQKTSILGLGELLTAGFQTDLKKRRLVEAFRAALPALPPSLYQREVDALPRVCPGQQARKRRGGEVQMTYNGVVLLEVADLTTAADVASVKERAAGWPTTLAAFTGASGQTVEVLVRGTLDDGTLPTEPEVAERFHKALYEVCATAYASVLGRPLLPRNAAPTDTFAWTYDPAPYLNTEAAAVRVGRRSIMSQSARSEEEALEYGPESTQPSVEGHSLMRRRFALAVSLAREKAERQPAGETAGTAATREESKQARGEDEKGRREDGKQESREEGKVRREEGSEAGQAAALLEAAAMEALRLGMPQEETVRQATRNLRFHALEAEEVRCRVESVYTENAPLAGRDRSHGMQELTFRLQDFMQARYDLRFNELTNGVEWRRNDSASFVFQTLDSRVMNTMIQECHESGLEVFDRDMKRYLGSTRVRDFNVARAYLRDVRGHWDGRTDHIGALADRVPTRCPHWRQWFHTWFLGMVAQWDGWDPLHGNSVVPLLVGPQGCGKSTFGQLLLPPELREAGYRELVDFGTKTEVERLLTTSLLINLDEFNQISDKTQQGFLKNLIQKASVKGRRPYSGVTQNLPRLASFIATTNMTDALADPSGSRRFIVAEVSDGQRINTTPPVPYEAIYAQAVAELEGGRRPYFAPDEVAELEAYNARFAQNRMEVLRFLDTFVLCTEPGPDVQRLRLTEITEAVRQRTGYAYTDKAFHYLGHWLTTESKMGRVHKSFTNGSPLYTVKAVGK